MLVKIEDFTFALKKRKREGNGEETGPVSRFLQAGEVVAEGTPQVFQAPEGVVVQGVAAEVLQE